MLTAAQQATTAAHIKALSKQYETLQEHMVLRTLAGAPEWESINRVVRRYAVRLTLNAA